MKPFTELEKLRLDYEYLKSKYKRLQEQFDECSKTIYRYQQEIALLREQVGSYGAGYDEGYNDCCAEKDKEIDGLKKIYCDVSDKLEHQYEVVTKQQDEIKRLTKLSQDWFDLSSKNCAEVKRLEGIVFKLVDIWVIPDDYLYEDRIKKLKEYCLKHYGIEIPTDEDK